MFVVELFDDLRRQILRQPFVEPRTGCQPLQAAILDVLGDRRPLVAAELHCLEGDEQDVQGHLQLRHVHPHARQREDRGEHGGLLGVDLVGQAHLLVLAHAAHGDVGLDHRPLRELSHRQAGRQRCGSNSSRRLLGCVWIRASTSRR